MGQVTDIAIVSMAGRYPGASTPAALWEQLAQGKDLATDVDRGEGWIGRHFAVDDIDKFDHAFFGVTPHEAQIMDPQHRLLLTLAYQALEDAGYERMPDGMRVGVFASSSISTYLIHVVLKSAFFDPSDLNYAVLLGNDRDTLATRISYKLNLAGPALSIQCACSSSLVAMHTACQSLLSGDTDMCLVGAVSLTVPQDRGYRYKQGGILSRDGYCRPFDRDATGTVKGNGCSVLVLRRLADAERDGDTIHAVIRGTAVNNDGLEKIGYTAPSIGGQQRVIAEALSFAGLAPADVDYIETHGTGTDLGDQIELSALAAAYRGAARTIPIGSLKANIGHLDVAAGITSVIKGTFALQTETVPPIANLQHPTCAVPEALDLFEFPQSRQKRGLKLVAVSSFGIGGTNAHALLERYTPPDRTRAGIRLPLAIVPVSVNRAEDFAGYARNIAEALRAGVMLHDLAGTLATRRKRRAVGQCFIATDAEELLLLLEADPSRTGEWSLQVPHFGEKAILEMSVELPALARAIEGAGSPHQGYLQLLARLGVLASPVVARANGWSPIAKRWAGPADWEAVSAVVLATPKIAVQQAALLRQLFDFLASVYAGSDLALEALYDGLDWQPIALPRYPLHPVRHWIEDAAVKSYFGELSPVLSKPAKPLIDDEVLSGVVAISIKHIGDEGIDADTVLWESGADSLAAVDILARINETYGCQLAFSADLPDKTPRELAALVLGREYRSSAPWLTSVRSRSARAKTIFLIHPAGGSTFCYRSLNRHISADLNLWSIDLPEGYQGYSSMHSLAARYAEAIRAKQPTGPYLLGGYSFGGNLAHEIARILEQDGCEVESVFMFDSHPPEAYNAYDGSSLDYIGAFPTMVAAYFKPEMIEQATEEGAGIRDLATALEIVRRLDLLRNGITDGDAAKFFERWKFSHTLLKAHRPVCKVKADLVLFVAQEPEPQLLLSKLKIQQVDKTAWRNYFTGAMMPIEVSGDHFTMFSLSRHVKPLAGHFQTALAASRMAKTQGSRSTQAFA